MYTLNNDEIKLMQRVKEYLMPSPWANAVYMTPAARLRKQADDWEAKEADLIAYAALLTRIQHKES